MKNFDLIRLLVFSINNMQVIASEVLSEQLIDIGQSPLAPQFQIPSGDQLVKVRFGESVIKSRLGENYFIHIQLLV